MPRRVTARQTQSSQRPRRRTGRAPGAFPASGQPVPIPADEADSESTMTAEAGAQPQAAQTAPAARPPRSVGTPARPQPGTVRPFGRTRAGTPVVNAPPLRTELIRIFGIMLVMVLILVALKLFTPLGA